MNENNQETHLAIKELAAEMRSFRQAMLISFALLCFAAGMVFLFPRSQGPLWVMLATAGIFLLWAGCSSIAKLTAEIREEARRQHAQPSSGPKNCLPESPVGAPRGSG